MYVFLCARSLEMKEKSSQNPREEQSKTREAGLKR
jgi:hypothetical protein